MIDERFLILEIKKHAKKVCKGNTVIDEAYQLAHEHIIELIQFLSKQSDFPQLVFCKECQYSKRGLLGLKCFLPCGLVGIHTNDFCSYGKRKKGVEKIG